MIVYEKIMTVDKTDIDDQMLEVKLKRKMKEWFGLQIEDLPTIIEKIGIKDKVYSLKRNSKTKRQSPRLLGLKIMTDDYTYRIELFGGEKDGEDIYPSVTIVNGNHRRVFAIEKNVNVFELANL